MRKNLGKWLLVWPPQAYLLFFFLVPALIMLFASFRFPGDYGGLAPWMYSEDGQTVYDLSVENYTRLTESCVPATVRQILRLRPGHHPGLPAARLPGGDHPRPGPGEVAQPADPAGDPAVLEQPAGTRLRLDDHPLAVRCPDPRDQRRAGPVRRAADQPDVHPVRGDPVHGLRAPAVHDPAALRQPGETRPGPAGRRPGPRRRSLATLLAGDLPALAAGVPPARHWYSSRCWECSPSPTWSAVPTAS